MWKACREAESEEGLAYDLNSNSRLAALSCEQLELPKRIKCCGDQR